MPVQPDRGPFLSFLEWLNQPSEAVLQASQGNFSAAGRKAADTLLNIPDVFLPGNVIPDLSRPEDRITASERFGIDPKENPLGAKLTDMIGGAAANPLSYLGIRGGAIKGGIPLTEGTAIPGTAQAMSRGRELLEKGAGLLPESFRTGASKTGEVIRRTFNWLDVPEEGQAMLAASKGEGNVAARAATERAKQIYDPLSQAESEAVGEAAQQIMRGGTTDRSKWKIIQDQEAYLQSLEGVPGIRVDKVREALKQRGELMNTLWDEGMSGGVFGRQFLTPEGQSISGTGIKAQMQQDIKSGLASADESLDQYVARRGFTEKGKGREDYIQSQFSGFEDVQDPVFRGSLPSALKKAEYDTPEKRLKLLQEQPGIDLEFSARDVDLRRAAQQGQLQQKASLGKRLTGKQDFTLADEAHRGAVNDAITEIRKTQPDFAYSLEQAFKGMKPRGQDFFSRGLYNANRLFKGAATYGIVLPRIAFNVRNRVGGLWQALSNDQARGTLGATSRRALSDLFGAFDDALVKTIGTKRMSGSELTRSLDAVDNAFQQAGGSPTKVRELLRQEKNGELLVEALDNGVLQDFVSAEKLLEEMTRTPKAQRALDFMNWPAHITRGIEMRMRLGTYLDLRKSKVAPDAGSAARTVSDTFLNYDTPGVENRLFRDVVPFGAFASQNIKQQSKFLTRHPVAGTVTAPLFSEEDEGLPKYPWQSSQMAVPLGLDEQGNAQYLSGLGLPIEGLGIVPGLNPRDAYKDTVGSMQPLLKTAIQTLSGRDAFTGGQANTYSNIAGNDLGEAGRLLNVFKGSGLNPLMSVTNPLEDILDQRQSSTEKLLENVTGLRMTSVDADRAAAQRIEQLLEARPDVKRYSGFYQTEKDPEVAELFTELRQAKERLKEKKAAAAAQ